MTTMSVDPQPVAMEGSVKGIETLPQNDLKAGTPDHPPKSYSYDPTDGWLLPGVGATPEPNKSWPFLGIHC